MLRLMLVKSRSGNEENNHVPLAPEITKELVYPWLETNRVVCGDAFFASVSTAEVLLEAQTQFIGFVKQSTKMFPMAAKASKEESR